MVSARLRVLLGLTKLSYGDAVYRGDAVRLKGMLAKFTTPVDIFWGRDPYEFM
jgi:hypothetical protein